MTARHVMVSMIVVAMFATADSPARDRPAAKGVCPAIRIQMQTCSAKNDAVGQRECMERLAERTNAELDGLEARIRAQVPLWDAEDDGMEVYRRQFGERLNAGITAYRHYRTAQCDMWAARAAGGNGADDMRLSCQVELDCQRVADMSDLLEAFEDR
jgi:Lysozyme inhibitor LprI